MNYLYCTIAKHLDIFDVIKLKIKSELDNLITFEFNDIIYKSQIDKKYINRTLHLRDDKGLFIITDDKNLINTHIEILSKVEKIKIRNLKSCIENYEFQIK